jgi:hypothetical protein
MKSRIKYSSLSLSLCIPGTAKGAQEETGRDERERERESERGRMGGCRRRRRRRKSGRRGRADSG